jgi:small subunit ribosomal protein S21
MGVVVMYGQCDRPAAPGLRAQLFLHPMAKRTGYGAGSVLEGAATRLNGERPLVQIFVRDNNVDQALKALKKKMQREGSFREMKRHVHYEKPSEKRARQQAEAVRRARKLARKRIQREGGVMTGGRPTKA